MPLCARWLPSLPANARAGLVLLKRPCTFVLALLLGALGALTALFYAVTNLHPPTCPSSDDTPRTRPRPTTPSSSSSTRAHPAKPTAFDSLHSLVTAPFRPAHRRPPPVHRHAGRTAGNYAVHELDGVVEAGEEEEEEADERDGRSRRSLSSREGGDETSSEADTLVDAEAVEAMEARSATGSGKAKGVKAGLVVLTQGLRWIAPLGHAHAHAKKDEPPVVESPGAYSHLGSPTLSAGESTSASSTASSSRKAPCPIKALRHRSATCSHPPRLPSTAAAQPTRRVTSDGRDYFSHHSPASPTSSSSGAAPSVADVHAHLAAPKMRKRASTSLFLRSLSPRTRSPVTTPEVTPPPSPRLSPSEHSSSSFAAAQITVQRVASLDSSAKSACGLKRRSRSPAPQRPPPVASRPSSNAVVDMQGSSGLALSDVLSSKFRS
ncbi:hypothetical protein JCM3775_004545 [Rhodotorula graminis]